MVEQEVRQMWAGGRQSVNLRAPMLHDGLDLRATRELAQVQNVVIKADSKPYFRKSGFPYPSNDCPWKRSLKLKSIITWPTQSPRRTHFCIQTR